MRGIIWVDMHLRDERALEWLRRQTRDGAAQIPHEQLARALGCHRNTARAIVERLAGARLISIDKSATRGGYVYSVVSH